MLRSTPTFYPHVTGPAYQAYKISKGLEKRGHESPIVTTKFVPENEEPGHPPDMSKNEDFPFRIKRRQHIFSIDQYRFPPQALFDYFNESPDIVHCHSYHNPIKDVFSVGNLLDSVSFVIHGHGSFSKKRDPTIERSIQFKLYDKIWFRTIKQADAVVVSSEQERCDAVEFGVPENKLHVIPVGKDPEVYRSVSPNKPENQICLLFVGRLAPRRNLELLIEAIAELDRDDIILRIVGSESTLSQSSRGNYVTELKQLANDKDVSDVVQFTGPKYGEDLIQEYRNAHYFVNPSHYENFGQAVLEAAFAGLPVLSTPTGVALKLIEEGENGYYFDDVDEFTEKINILLSSNSRAEMSSAISRKAMLEYSWDSIIDKYASLYEAII